jgi:ferric-dicitrate binding protein FerR (iron transport regulator)
MSENNYIEFNEATLMAYINNELAEEQMGMVDHWLTLSEDNQEEMDKLKRIWEESKMLKVTPVMVDTEAALKNVLAKINKNEDKKGKATEALEVPITKPINAKRIVFSAAAVLIALFGLVGLLNYINGSVEQINLTASSEIIETELSDGTKVSLNANSSLKYQSQFSSNERRVGLEGEAFFDVERNEEKPFIIDLPNEFYVKVLGTSFNIDADKQDSLTEVYVKSGKVEFGSKNDKILLVAGEKGIMSNKTGKVRKVVETNGDMKILGWQSQDLNFDNITLLETIEILENVYDTQIELKCTEVGENLVVSPHKKSEPLDSILKVISSVHSLDVEKQGSIYTLSCD